LPMLNLTQRTHEVAEMFKFVGFVYDFIARLRILVCMHCSDRLANELGRTADGVMGAAAFEVVTDAARLRYIACTCNLILAWSVSPASRSVYANDLAFFDISRDAKPPKYNFFCLPVILYEA
jgi:hypothetical protein